MFLKKIPLRVLTVLPLNCIINKNNKEQETSP